MNAKTVAKNQISESTAYFANFSLVMNSFYGVIEANNKKQMYVKRKRFQILKRTGEITRNFFWEIVKELDIDVFVECGANDASVSRQFLESFPERRALAIEANPRVFEYYREVNEKISTLEYLNLGVSDKQGTLDFYIPKVTEEEISIFGSFQKLPYYDYYPAIKVQTLPVDKIIKRNKRADKSLALWIDVEGQLSKLIKGAHHTLKSKNCKILYCEVQDDNHYSQEATAQEIVDTLWGYGFIPVGRDFFTEPFYNLMFVKADVMQYIHVQRAIYVKELISIKIPVFLMPDIKSKLSRIKALILKRSGVNLQRFIHKIASFLGSESSRKASKKANR